MPTLFHDYLAAFEAALRLEQRTHQHHEVREYSASTFYIVRTEA
jgi:hypothetical protein